MQNYCIKVAFTGCKFKNLKKVSKQFFAYVQIIFVFPTAIEIRLL